MIDALVRKFLAAKMAAGELQRVRYTECCHYGEGQATLCCMPRDTPLSQ